MRRSKKEFCLGLQSRRGTRLQVIAQVWCWIQDPGVSAHNRCTSTLNFYIKFWLMMRAGYLFIYLPVNLLFVRAGCTGVEKQGSAWVITQKKFLPGMQIIVLCSIAQVISTITLLLSSCCQSHTTRNDKIHCDLFKWGCKEGDLHFLFLFLSFPYWQKKAEIKHKEK